MRGIVFILLVFAGYFSLVVFLNKPEKPGFILPKTTTTQETLNLDGLPEGGLTDAAFTQGYTRGYWMVIEGPPKAGSSHNWKFIKEMQEQVDDL